MTTATTPYPELQQIIREETDNGRGIVRFLFKAMEGEFLKTSPQHTGSWPEESSAFWASNRASSSSKPTKSPKSPETQPSAGYSTTRPKPNSARRNANLSDYTKRVSKNGRRMVRFFLDAMDGLITSFRPSLRIAAAKELHRLRLPATDPGPPSQDCGTRATTRSADPPAHAAARSRRRSRTDSPVPDRTP